MNGKKERKKKRKKERKKERLSASAFLQAASPRTFLLPESLCVSTTVCFIYCSFDSGS